ncbi:MAG: HAD-IIIC family phosphatase [Rhizobium sp.]|nr:HAD-IIIC family phosphatase [Rhizobium sp.]
MIEPAAMRDSPGFSDKHRVRSLSKLWRNRMREGQTSLPPDASVAISSTFTDHGIAEFLGALLLEAGFQNPEVKSAEYNQVIQTCLDHAEAFGPIDPGLISIAFRLEDLSSSDDTQIVSEAVEVLLAAITTLRTRYEGMIIVGLPPRPRSTTEDIATFSKPSELYALWHQVCVRIHEICQLHDRIYTFDLEAEICRLGEISCLSPRDEMLYRQPYTPELQLRLAERILRLHTAQNHEPKKCIVLDCDNTLWGGIIGEDGLNGIELSYDFPGKAYRDFQRQLKSLRDSGIFLAICSKNNPAEVEEMFERHTGMLLSKDDISAWQVNWETKSKNLVAIAESLNIGLDSLVFIDDNPFEIEEVKANAPGVTCLILPEDAAQIPNLLKGVIGLFDRLEITAEDQKRVTMVQKERYRTELAQNVAPEEYLASLDLCVRMISPTEGEIARITQLVNKTNQFNITTKRYTAQEVAKFVQDPSMDVFCTSVLDRFGDYGIVGVTILRHEGPESIFDTLLLSCRVLARGVESAMISYGIDLARRRGALKIVGQILPTAKNQMVTDLFLKHGFEAVSAKDNFSTFTRGTHQLKSPSYLRVIRPECNDS